MSSSGGVVIVEAGIYIIDGTNNLTISVPSNVTLIGNGKAVLSVQSDVPAIKNSNQTIGNERIVISGFKIVADRSGSSYYNNLIDMQYTINSIIENNTLIVKLPGSSSNGIYLYGSDLIKAEGNIITGNMISGDGISEGPYTGIELYQYCINNIITSNTVYNCRDNLSIKDNSNNNIICNNVIRNSNASGSFGGIYIYNSNYNTINGNEATSNNYGVYLRSSNFCSVQDNVCTSNRNDGIRIGGDSSSLLAEKNSVVGNVTASNSSTGIRIAQYARYTSVGGNNSSNNGYGISEDTSNTNYNALIGNICKDNSTAQFTKYGANSVGDQNNNVF